MAHNGTLSTKERRFVGALVGARSVRDAAETASVSERSAWRYLSDGRVKAEIATRQDGMLAQVTAGLVDDMARARQVLREVMEARRTPAGVRVRAAGMILDHGSRFAELVTLAERVARLEKIMEQERWRG